MLLILLATFILCVNGNLYNVTYNQDSIVFECNRFYEAKKGTCTTSEYSWDGIDSQYPFANVKTAFANEGLSGIKRECERICGDTNICRAYSVSSARDILLGNIHCNIYSICDQEVNGDTDLFIREAPFNCFIKATSAEGTFKNYNDNSNPWSQLSRQLIVYVKPFMEIHVMINGVVDSNTHAIKPFKELGEYCDMEDELDCLFLYSGWLGVGLFAAFVAIVTGNLILIFTKDKLI